MLLDEVCPIYDVASRHAIHVAAAPDRVYRAVRTVDLGRPRLVRILMGIRSLPAWVAAAWRGRRLPAPVGGTQRPVHAASFTVITEEPGVELVLGIVGRFWTLGGGVVNVGADEFRRPPAPGLAQGVWNLRVEPEGTGARLSTETRVRCADADTRRRFLRYWRFIRLGSSLTRRSILQLIRRTAEQRTIQLTPAADWPSGAELVHTRASIEAELHRLNALLAGPAGSAQARARERAADRFGASERLIVYGSLAPGHANHYELAPLGGAWTCGWITGDLLHTGWGAALGYPAIRWRAGGERVQAWLLCSPALPGAWARLDAFEGTAYQRLLAPFETEAGVLAVGYFYAAAAGTSTGAE